MRQGFESFMRKVDVVLESKYHVSHLDLPDVDYWSMYDAGMTAKATANIAVVNAWEEYGLDPTELIR